MIPYYIMVAIPIFFSIVYGKSSEKLNESKRQKIIIWSFFVTLLIILMLRHKTVGADIKHYINQFKKLEGLSLGQLFERYESERGYWLFNRIISMFTTNERWFLIIMAIVTTIPVARLYARESENALLLISIFLISSNFDMIFTGLRQSIAIAIVAWSFKYVKEKKLLKFILLITLAFFFHKSAIIAFLIYPIYHSNITRARLLLFVPVIAVVFIYNQPIFEFLLQFLGEYGEEYSYKETGAYNMIILFALFVLLSYIAPDEQNIDTHTRGLRNIGVLALVIQIFALASPIAMRMNYYFILFTPVMIPKVINKCMDKNKPVYKYVSLAMIVFFISYYFLRAETGADILQVYPYKYFWE